MEILTHGVTKSIPAVTASERKQMFSLMLDYYDGMTEEKFNCDLDEKEAVMTMLDSRSGAIVGFSTFKIFDLGEHGVGVKGFFSGDTVVREEYRRTATMGVEIGKNFLTAVQRFPLERMYWILISKGCRTYRILPIFFREWYPRYDRETPEEIRNVMDMFGAYKYPDQYDGSLGLIIASSEAEVLRVGVAEAHEGRLKDPHIQYFVQRNPDHIRGNELVCVAEITVKNFAPAFVRMLRLAGVKLNE